MSDEISQEIFLILINLNYVARIRIAAPRTSASLSVIVSSVNSLLGKVVRRLKFTGASGLTKRMYRRRSLIVFVVFNFTITRPPVDSRTWMVVRGLDESTFNFCWASASVKAGELGGSGDPISTSSEATSGAMLPKVKPDPWNGFALT
jgi:hypothetical protein